MSEIKLIQGGISIDERGQIAHANDLDMNDAQRFYVIQNASTEVIRAWHAHQHEKKWYTCLKGSFTMAFVKIDDWENPSPDLVPEVYQLSAENSQVICVPEGYAGGLKANEEGSILLVLSSKRIPEALQDSWRYDKHMWMKW